MTSPRTRLRGNRLLRFCVSPRSIYCLGQVGNPDQL